MANITPVYQRYSIEGDRRRMLAEISCVSGDVLKTGFSIIEAVSFNNTAIENAAVTPPSVPGGTASITFTTSGAVTDALVSVSGY